MTHNKFSRGDLVIFLGEAMVVRGTPRSEDGNYSVTSKDGLIVIKNIPEGCLELV